jgi:hypothetical protein
MVLDNPLGEMAFCRRRRAENRGKNSKITAGITAGGSAAEQRDNSGGIGDVNAIIQRQLRNTGALPTMLLNQVGRYL